MMQACGAAYEYKIHLAGSLGFVGSNSRHTSGDIYVTAPKYNLSHSYHVRNKRIFDIGFSLVLIALLPMLLFKNKAAKMYRNTWQVLVGKRTWVGYSTTKHAEKLPVLKAAVLPTYNKVAGVTPSQVVKEKLDVEYALYYNVFNDVRLVIKNFKFLGEN
ncbi:MAG: hypothetical protein E6Q89_06215 [Bacteroidia bacterium]|nr:MAG: hypothetical protein E6Q89_06215 [Bacteroidia bacterium]